MNVAVINPDLFGGAAAFEYVAVMHGAAGVIKEANARLSGETTLYLSERVRRSICDSARDPKEAQEALDGGWPRLSLNEQATRPLNDYAAQSAASRVLAPAGLVSLFMSVGSIFDARTVGRVARIAHDRLADLQRIQAEPNAGVKNELRAHARYKRSGRFESSSPHNLLSERAVSAMAEAKNASTWADKTLDDRRWPPSTPILQAILGALLENSILGTAERDELRQLSDDLACAEIEDLALLEFWNGLSARSFELVEMAKHHLAYEWMTQRDPRWPEINLFHPLLTARLADHAVHMLPDRGVNRRDERWAQAVVGLAKIHAELVGADKPTLLNRSGYAGGPGLDFIEQVGLMYLLPLKQVAQSSMWSRS